MNHGLDRKDDHEIQARLARIREARSDVNRLRKRNALTMKQLSEVLGDECGTSHATRLQEAQQERTGRRKGTG